MIGPQQDNPTRTLISARTADGSPCTVIVQQVDLPHHPATGVVVAWQATTASMTLFDRAQVAELRAALDKAA